MTNIESPVSIKYNKELKEYIIDGNAVRCGETKVVSTGIIKKAIISISPKGSVTIVSDDLSQAISIEGREVKKIIFEQ